MSDLAQQRKDFLMKNAAGLMTELLTEIAIHQPDDLMGFIHEWSGDQIINRNNNTKASSERKIPDDLKRSVPVQVFPDDIDAHKPPTKSPIKEHVMQNLSNFNQGDKSIKQPMPDTDTPDKRPRVAPIAEFKLSSK